MLSSPLTHLFRTQRCRVWSSGGEPEHQEYFICRTCGLVDGICSSCAEVCHRGHALSTKKSGTIICACGTSPHCLITSRPTLRVRMPLRLCSFAFTGPNFTEQVWFFCRTCFRNEQKGICTSCAHVCHEGHNIQFGSESRFYCDCSDRYGMPCKCASHLVVAPDSQPRYRCLQVEGPKESEEEEEEEEDDGENACIVCMDRGKNAMFYRCGHIAACMDCACMLKQRNDPCLICREPIEAVVRTFYA